MIVIDASALTDGLIDEDPARRAQVWSRVGQEDQPVAPALIDLEVVSSVRREMFAGSLDLLRGEAALAEFADVPLRRFPHQPLLTSIWALRNNVTAYDAAYVALAQLLGVPLLTSDARLARAVESLCEVELLSG